MTRGAEAPGKRGHSRLATHVFRDLLFVLTWRDVTVKYKQSVMGLLWAIFMPAVIVGAGALIRIALSKVSGRPLSLEDVASMSVKALPWAFVVSGIRFATGSLTANLNLVTKVNCPRIAFPLSAVLSALFDLVIAIIPLVVVLAWCGVTPSLSLLWVPPIIAVLMLLVSGLGIALAAANLFFRDVKYIVEVLLTFAIFFTPVIFDVDMLGEWRFWALLNPIAPLLEGLRSAIILGTAPDLHWLLYSAILSAILFVGGWRMFHRLEPAFAEYA